MTKGILVLLMVAYHTLNYTNQYHLAFRYLSFLPLSFIVITGFLLSTVYSPRYAAGNLNLPRRLMLRGVRLLVLFTLLNIIAQFVRSPAYGHSVGIAGFFQHWEAVYLIGGSRMAVFEVLLPIAYLLLLAPCLIAIAQRYASFLLVASTLLVLTCALLDQFAIALVNVTFLGAGIVGMLAGRVLPEASILGRFVWLTLLAYVVYFPLGVTRGWVFLIQLLGAFTALALICGVSVRLGRKGWWHERVMQIGRYSLVSYIAQIAILQVLSRIIGRPDPLSVPALMLLVSTLVLTSLLVEATEWLRNRSTGISKLYSAVFA
jgi:hypothetical protein